MRISSVVVGQFRELLEKAEQLFPNKQSFAAAIGITPSRYSHIRKGHYSLNIINCLRLAKAASLSPSLVLRQAGKGELAALIEQLYGEGVKPVAAAPLSVEDQHLLEGWNDLTPVHREAVLVVIDLLRRDQDARKRPRRAS